MRLRVCLDTAYFAENWKLIIENNKKNSARGAGQKKGKTLNVDVRRGIQMGT